MKLNQIKSALCLSSKKVITQTDQSTYQDKTWKAQETMGIALEQTNTNNLTEMMDWKLLDLLELEDKEALVAWAAATV